MTADFFFQKGIPEDQIIPDNPCCHSIVKGVMDDMWAEHFGIDQTSNPQSQLIHFWYLGGRAHHRFSPSCLVLMQSVLRATSTASTVLFPPFFFLKFSFFLLGCNVSEAQLRLRDKICNDIAEKAMVNAITENELRVIIAEQMMAL